MSYAASSWEQGKEKGWVLERAQLGANEDCYTPHMPLEKWDCFAKGEPARLGNTIQPQFSDRDIAATALLKRSG